MAKQSVRVVPAVFHAKSSGAFIPSVRFIDPDLKDEDDGRVFLTVDVKHLEGIIVSMRKAAVEATARADQLRNAEPEDKALLMAAAGGRA
ncbi:hypothetical protein D3C71_314760 [compost metagenome]